MNRSRAMAYVWALVVIVPCVVALHTVSAVTAVAAAPVLILAVIIVARTWGTGPGLVASASAAAGTYYVRVVAVNTDGTSAPSNDQKPSMSIMYWRPSRNPTSPPK